MQRDIQSVLQGHSPMADAEVQDAMRSSVGLSPITDPSKGHGLLDILGNIPSDIKNIVTGFIPGTLGYITSLPQQAMDIKALAAHDPATLKQYGWEDPSDIGSVLRDMSKAPIVGPLVPGLHTAAGLTTDVGRKSLEEHPVSTAIDVGSAVAEAGKLGAFGKGAEAAGAETRLAAEEAGTAVPSATAKEALQAGQPYRAAGRAMLSGAEHLPGANITRTSIRNVLTDLNLHPDLVSKLARPYNVIKNKLDRQMHAFIRNEIVRPILDLKVLDHKNKTDLSGTFNRVMDGQTVLTPEETKMLQESSIPSQALDVQGRVQASQPFLDENGHLTDAAKQLVSDPKTAESMDPALVEAIRKVMDNETWWGVAGTPEATDMSIHLRVLGRKARKWMDEQARENPNLVGVVADVTKPYGPKWYYHKNHPVAKKFAAHQQAYAAVDTAAKDLATATDARRTLNTPQSLQDWFQAGEKLKKAQSNLSDTRSAFNEEFNRGAPASFYDLLAERVRGRAISYAQAAPERVAALEKQLVEAKTKGDANRVSELEDQIAKEGPRMPLDLAIERIRGSFDTQMLSEAIGPEAAKQLMSEVEMTWRSLAQEGVHPIFLPNIKDSRLEHIRFPTVVPEVPHAPAHVSKNTAFNLSRSVNDVAVGLIEIKRQQLTEAGTAEFANTWIKKWVRVESTTANEIQDAIRNGGPMTADLRSISKAEMDRHYKTWDPKTNGFGVYFPSIEGGRYVMPRGVAQAIHWLGFESGHGPFQMKYDQIMKVWRFSILTTPRHMSHVILGGAMMGILRDPLFIPHFIENFKQAKGIMQGDNYELLAMFGGNANDFTPEQLYAIGAGKSMGRIATAVSKGFRGVNKFEESATMMYKITQMLRLEKKGVKSEEAIGLANKMFVDMNSMLPIERVFLRKIFPFYGFTRHLFRYLMTYPADHPYSASILTNFANQHQADWKSGLPADMSFMFYLGAPDINGNVNAVDYRSLDPFRSFYNMFTLGGFMSQANPAVQLVAEQMGVNVLSATPELYPNVHYDPSTGQMVADQPSNFLLRLMESTIPETSAIDAKFQLSDQFKNLKTSDPAAFQHRVYTSLGIPFGYETINVPAKEQNAQMKRYRDAQTSINQAVQSGDFTKAKRYSYVPVPSLLSAYIPGQYATPQQIEAVYRALQQRTGTDVSLHAVLPKPTRRRTTP